MPPAVKIPAAGHFLQQLGGLKLLQVFHFRQEIKTLYPPVRRKDLPGSFL